MATLSTKSEKLHQTIKRKQLLNRSGCLFGVLYEENNLRPRLKKSVESSVGLQSSLFKQERRRDSQRVIANRLACQQALCNRRKRQGGSQRVTVTDLLCLLSSTTSTVQTRVQCNDNSTRSYENQSVTEPYQSLLKLL
jgi:hypothetical protein